MAVIVGKLDCNLSISLIIKRSITKWDRLDVFNVHDEEKLVATKPRRQRWTGKKRR